MLYYVLRILIVGRAAETPLFMNKMKVCPHPIFITDPETMPIEQLLYILI